MRYGSTVLFVDDVPAILEFYRRAFGFETRFYDDDYEFGELDAGGTVLGFGSHRCGERMMPGGYSRPEGGHPSGVEVAFLTTEVSAAFERAIGAGAVPVAEPKVMPWGQTVAYVRSIEGTIIGFCTPLER
ncbi:VOC family protein [Tautonia sp. JC769]|uniref:VOC family protein n=1 Tax=Tautonia sp. JC769 TaxID=3232135 RepID=UPI003457CA53